MVTHASPVGRIFNPDDLSRAGYILLHINECWDIIDANRKLNDIEPVSDGEKADWKLCVALTGGHPSLLLDAFEFRRKFRAYNTTNVHLVVSSLLVNKRVKDLPSFVNEVTARNFILDVFARAEVPASFPNKYWMGMVRTFGAYYWESFDSFPVSSESYESSRRDFCLRHISRII